MKKIFYLFLVSLLSLNVFSQVKGSRVGFIDMEYILEKVPNYAEAKNQLDLKAQKWKQEIEEKKNEINKLKENLKTETPLLTKELIEEREDEIQYLETVLLEYQQSRFGPKGDLIIQKTTLVKPIQDQVFAIVQDIAAKKNYDFIFDKSSDLSMLFAAKQFDISDQVIRQLVRAEKREQLTAKELKEQEKRDAMEDMKQENPEYVEREKVLEEKKEARLKAIEDKKKLADEKRAAAAANRQKLIDEKNAKKNGTLIEEVKKDGDDKTDDPVSTDGKKSAADIKKEAEEKRQKALEERNRIIEEKKKEAQAKRQKILDDREAAKKAKEEQNKPKE